MAESFNESVAGRVRELREARGWTAEELASRSGVPRTTATTLGKHVLTLQTVVRMAAAFDVPFADLVPEEALSLAILEPGSQPAEGRMADKLGISIGELGRRANVLWGRGFVEERDARTNAPQGTATGTRRAARGQASRDLIAELRLFERIQGVEDGAANSQPVPSSDQTAS